jgi:hypothetical protein
LEDSLERLGKYTFPTGLKPASLNIWLTSPG